MKEVFLITGATGNVGRAAAQELVAKNYKVRGVTRSHQNANRMPASVQAVVADISQPESLAEALRGVTALFLIPSTGNTKKLLSIAKGAGVEHVVLLSGGIATTNDRDNPIAAQFLDEEAAVKESGIDWTILRPGAFMTNVLGWAGQLKHGDIVRAPFSHLKQAMIDPRDIGNVVAAILMHREKYAGMVYELTGREQLTNADRAQIIAEVLERPITYEPITAEQAHAAMSKTMPREHVKAFFDFHGDGNVYEPALSSAVRDITAHEPRSFRDWLVDYKQAFSKD